VLQDLVRTEAAGYRLSEAVPFATLVQEARPSLRAMVQPMETLLTELPAATLTDEGVRWARQGRNLGPAQMHAPLSPIPPLARLLGPDERLIGLADQAKVTGFLHPSVIFSYN
jgi:tRNA U55 pseudouridine synthase TruB